MVIETRSPEETFQLGEELGRKAVPGQVFTLTGDPVSYTHLTLPTKAEV